MKAKKHLIVVGGATASGKTSTAIALARHFDTVILSADSRQFYREMTIGTAKPSPEELAQAPHYFIDSQSITSNYSVGDFEQEALTLLRQLYEQRDVVILAGGSGLYINALCQGLDQFPTVPLEIREYYEQRLEIHGLEVLQEELQRVDPAYAKKVDLQNPHRLIRALSVHRVSGRPFSSFLGRQTSERFFTPIYLQMDWSRDELYDRINQRVELMLEAGLEQEVRDLRVYQGHSALATVGYQEWMDYFDKKIDRLKVVELIKRNSRRYAKRQLTWMRRDGFWKHFSPKDLPAIIDYVEWRINQAYELKTYSQTDSQLMTYQEENQVVAQLQVDKTGKYAIAQLQVAQDQRAVASLITEFSQRAANIPQFLILPENVELSTQKLGFQETNDQQKLPAPVRNAIAPGCTLLCKGQKK